MKKLILNLLLSITFGVGILSTANAIEVITIREGELYTNDCGGSTATTYICEKTDSSPTLTSEQKLTRLVTASKWQTSGSFKYVNPQSPTIVMGSGTCERILRCEAEPYTKATVTAYCKTGVVLGFIDKYEGFSQTFTAEEFLPIVYDLGTVGQNICGDKKFGSVSVSYE